MLATLYISLVIVWAVALAWWDFREHRLPDALTLPAIPFASLCVAIETPDRLGIAAASGIGLFVCGLVAHQLADLGFGDVKLLPTAGILSTAQQSDGLLVWFVVTALVGGIHSAIELAVSRNPRSHIPFGPAILFGLVVVVISG